MIVCPRSSSYDGPMPIAHDPALQQSNSQHETSPSVVVRSRSQDVEIRSLESKLQLLDEQRQLSALRCQSFIDLLQSAVDARPPEQDHRLDRRHPSHRARRASLDLSRGDDAQNQWAQELRFYEEPARMCRSQSHSGSPAASRSRFTRSRSHRGTSGSSPVTNSAFHRRHSSPSPASHSPTPPIPPTRMSHPDKLGCSVSWRESSGGACESFMASRRSLKDRPSTLSLGGSAYAEGEVAQAPMRVAADAHEGALPQSVICRRVGRCLVVTAGE